MTSNSVVTSNGVKPRRVRGKMTSNDSDGDDDDVFDEDIDAPQQFTTKQKRNAFSKVIGNQII